MAKESIQDKILPVMVTLLIGAAFMLGMMWGKVQVYEQGYVPTENQGIGDGEVIEDEVQLNEEEQNILKIDPAFAFGDEDAPVTLVEFTDYECPFCKGYIDNTSGSLISDYVDTGKIRYVIRDLPLSFHNGATTAALAARCAGDQDKYMEMHDAIFSGQEEWAGTDGVEIFKGYSSSLGLNTSAFNDCMDSGKYLDAIEADASLAAQYGASGTPSFFINGQLLVGAQPLSVFQGLIEVKLES